MYCTRTSIYIYIRAYSPRVVISSQPPTTLEPSNGLTITFRRPFCFDFFFHFFFRLSVAVDYRAVAVAAATQPSYISSSKIFLVVSDGGRGGGGGGRKKRQDFFFRSKNRIFSIEFDRNAVKKKKNYIRSKQYTPRRIILQRTSVQSLLLYDAM